MEVSEEKKVLPVRHRLDVPSRAGPQLMIIRRSVYIYIYIYTVYNMIPGKDYAGALN